MRHLLPVCLAIALAGQAADQRMPVDADLPSYRPSTDALSADLNVVGGSSMKATVQAWTQAFSKMYPNVKFRITAKGSSTAAAPLVTGISQIAPMGRELWDSELTQFRFTWGHMPLGLRVARGSYNIPQRSQILAVYVNKDNPIQKLTLAQLDAIFSKSRRRGYPEQITTWGQLGLTGDWAKQPIHPFDLSEDSTGVGEWFRVRVMQKGKWRDVVEDEPSPQEMVRHITEDRYAIGFTGISYLNPNIKVVALAEDPAGPYSSGSLSDVQRGVYPLTRFMYIYIDKVPDKPLPPAIKEFLEYVLSKEGQQAAVEAGELLPLSAAVAKEERAKLEKP